MADSTSRRGSEERRYSMYSNAALRSSKSKTGSRKTHEEISQSVSSTPALRYGSRSPYTAESGSRSSGQSLTTSRQTSPSWFPVTKPETLNRKTDGTRCSTSQPAPATYGQPTAAYLWTGRKSNPPSRSNANNTYQTGSQNASRKIAAKPKTGKKAVSKYDADGILVIDEDEEEEGFGMTLGEYVSQMHTTQSDPRRWGKDRNNSFGRTRAQNNRIPSGGNQIGVVSNTTHAQATSSGNNATSVWRYDRSWDVGQWTAAGSSVPQTPLDGNPAGWRGGSGTILAASSNLLDLRPGTAIPSSSGLSATLSMDMDPITKQVDLGGLPTSLFRPNSRQVGSRSSTSNSARQSTTSQSAPFTEGRSSGDQHPNKGPSSPLIRAPQPPSILTPNLSPLASPTNSSCSTLASPLASPLAHSPTSPISPVALSSSKRTPSGSILANSRVPSQWGSTTAGGTAKGGTALGSTAKGSTEGTWARGVHNAAQKSSVDSNDSQPASVSSQVEDASESGVVKSRRLVQSARPATNTTTDQEIDPSVWHANVERPPSRQKPPPEALHLFSPGHDVRMKARWNNLPARPHSANLVGCLRVPPQSFFRPDLDRHSSARPPTRQKPPPESLDLGHGDALRDHSPSNTSPLHSTTRQIFTSDSESEA